MHWKACCPWDMKKQVHQLEKNKRKIIVVGLVIMIQIFAKIIGTMATMTSQYWRKDQNHWDFDVRLDGINWEMGGVVFFYKINQLLIDPSHDLKFQYKNYV